jgi:hypothetical protein
MVFLLPFVAAARSEDIRYTIGDTVPSSWEVDIHSARPATAGLVLDVTRHAMAHLFDHGLSTAAHEQGVDWDAREFRARIGRVRFTTERGLAQFTSDIIAAVQAAARRQLDQRARPTD